jgi:hypothetical protein
MLFQTLITPINFSFYEFNIFPGDRLDGMLGGLVYFSPFLIVNYLLIFWRDRYKILIEKYEYKYGNYGLIYILGTSIVFAILALIFIIWKIVTE